VSVKIIWVNRHTIVDNKPTWIKQLSKKWRKTQFIENKALTESYLNSFLESLEPNSETDSIVHIHGSDFQQGIWQALLDIPSGETRTYREIAQAIGNPKAHRAVGTAIASNPVAVLIPCHRVIRADGRLGGYRWGEDKKVELLNLEFNNKPEENSV